jgi:hypothetical protein
MNLIIEFILMFHNIFILHQTLIQMEKPQFYVMIFKMDLVEVVDTLVDISMVEIY